MGATATILSAGSTVNQTIGGIQSGNAILARSRATAQSDEWNARLADLQAQDAITRGSMDANATLDATRARVASARAAAGASGVDVSSGSALAVQAGTARTGAYDAMLIRVNAARQAWGFTTQGQFDRAQGQYARAAGQQEAGATYAKSMGTFLTGTADTYGLYRKWKGQV